MDDLYAINAAKNPNSGIALTFPTRRGFWRSQIPSSLDFSDGQPSRNLVRKRTGELENPPPKICSSISAARLAVIVNEIRLQGDVAYDYGCHELTLTRPNRAVSRCVVGIATWISGGEIKGR